MHFTKLISLASMAAVAAAGSVTFNSYDTTDRVVYFTASVGQPSLPSVAVQGGDTVRVDFPTGWIGNWYSISGDAPNVPGMLGEVSFDSWGGLCFYDVSAIVNPNDHDGVHELFPSDDPQEPRSGCTVFPCDTAYYLPDDIQTQSSPSGDLTCTLGSNSGATKRESSGNEYPAFPRHFVERRW